MKRPSSEKILLAADWVEGYESGCDVSEELQEVADWMRKLVRDFEKRKLINECAKKHGTTPVRIRKLLKQNLAKS